jgi:hypothetical protein
MRFLDPEIAAVLDVRGATPEEKDALLGFILNQAASARGRVAGLRGSASDLNRQADEAEAQAASLEAMVEKFTNEVPDEILEGH